MPNAQRMNSMDECIQNCWDCHTVCLQTIQYCLSIGGKHVEASHLKLLANCAEICQTSANFLITGSEFQPRTCEVCAEVCERCADSCEKLDGNDSQMRACAEMCRRCATSCRNMSSGPRMAA